MFNPTLPQANVSMNSDSVRIHIGNDFKTIDKESIVLIASIVKTPGIESFTLAFDWGEVFSNEQYVTVYFTLNNQSYCQTIPHIWFFDNF